MADNIDNSEALVDDSVDQADTIGQTSDEAAIDVKKESLLSSMTVFDAMLLISLICVVLATFMMFFELRIFGDFPSEFPWRTNEITNQ
ncbi:MAG: hypothetical protein ACI87E_003345 [Mariniblastus sp.]|jgi:hypothetical protein